MLHVETYCEMEYNVLVQYYDVFTVGSTVLLVCRTGVSG